MAPYFIKSRRGKNLLVNKGFIYSKHSKNKDRTYWVCLRKPECYTRATTTEDPLRVVNEGEHVHAPDPAGIAARAAIEHMKEAGAGADWVVRAWAGVQAPERPSVHIIDQEMHRLGDGVVARLPLRPAMKKAVNRARGKRLPANPKSIHELGELPPEFRNTLGGDPFVVYDSYDDLGDSDSDDEGE
ncbi:FLYWCH-type zinc finger-containing protein 1 [Frankliniella fusca]|uniref:FLYWCH-type zinc finger-containing protein 1 n=1 Tax=Frankliniella fusca TaxID=407009 RepID=A0AAE1L8K7_9NEOP|nr:FLYWCH-type zinc finger-containing protein 1 [Frankliniella fusca]